MMTEFGDSRPHLVGDREGSRLPYRSRSLSKASRKRLGLAPVRRQELIHVGETPGDGLRDDSPLGRT